MDTKHSMRVIFMGASFFDCSFDLEGPNSEPLQLIEIVVTANGMPRRGAAPGWKLALANRADLRCAWNFPCLRFLLAPPRAMNSGAISIDPINGSSPACHMALSPRRSRVCATIFHSLAFMDCALSILIGMSRRMAFLTSASRPQLWYSCKHENHWRLRGYTQA
jgi:hypothetical protein